MESKTKKILIAAGIVIAIAGFSAYRKARKVAEIFDKMEIDPVWADDFKIQGGKLKFNIDVKLTNKSDDDLFISGLNVAKLKTLYVYYDTRLFGVAQVNITKISIPSNRELILHNIPVESNAVNLIANAGTITSFDVNKITCTATIEALGSTYQIG